MAVSYLIFLLSPMFSSLVPSVPPIATATRWPFRISSFCFLRCSPPSSLAFHPLPLQLGGRFVSHLFAFSDASPPRSTFHHCDSVVFSSLIFLLTPTFSSPFYLPPLQLGGCFVSHLFACLLHVPPLQLGGHSVSHLFARSDVPPSPAQPSTTPTTALDHFIA